MAGRTPISRRSVLRGLGVSLALPSLEAMTPRKAVAAASAPRRMAYVYLPNGVIMDQWRPQGEGSAMNLHGTLETLKPFQNELQVFSGLDHEKAEPNGDGGGDHARANTTFLTGAQAHKTDGADIRAGISVDQVAAQSLGANTRIDSLQLACDVTRNAGRCDSGYSCAYQYNFSWASPTTPIAPEVDPRVVFDKLFGSGVLGEERELRARRALYHKSILDYVTEDAQKLQSQLGRNDQQKLDEYLTGVRDLERRIENAEKFTQELPEASAPTGIPSEFADHIRLMYELMAMAFQTDTTRIASFLVAYDGSNRSFNQIGVPQGHHALSHHRNDPAKIESLRKIDRFYVEQFAWFMDRLRKTPEADGSGSLLDNSMIVFGGGHSDGNRHSHTDLPLVLAGKGGGSLSTGRHVHHGGKPMTNLFLSLLDQFGAGEGVDRLGDSTGRLANI